MEIVDRTPSFIELVTQEKTIVCGEDLDHIKTRCLVDKVFVSYVDSIHAIDKVFEHLFTPSFVIHRVIYSLTHFQVNAENYNFYGL